MKDKKLKFSILCFIYLAVIGAYWLGWGGLQYDKFIHFDWGNGGFAIAITLIYLVALPLLSYFRPKLGVGLSFVFIYLAFRGSIFGEYSVLIDAPDIFSANDSDTFITIILQTLVIIFLFFLCMENNLYLFASILVFAIVNYVFYFVGYYFLLTDIKLFHLIKKPLYWLAILLASAYYIYLHRGKVKKYIG